MISTSRTIFRRTVISGLNRGSTDNEENGVNTLYHIGRLRQWSSGLLVSLPPRLSVKAIRLPPNLGDGSLGQL